MARRGSAIHIDDHELRDLQIDMSKAPVRIRNPNGVRKAAKAIEREMKVDATGHTGSYFTPRKRHLTATDLPRYVSSEMVGPLSAEIGIESRGAGALGHIIAYGSVNNPAAYDPGAGPRRAMPRVLDALADQAEESVLGRRGKA
jgi:hypothetical protein